MFLFSFRIPAHRNVLYGASEYFGTLFTTEMKERSQTEISIQKVDGDVLLQLVNYCYIGEIGIDSANVVEMTNAANMLRFTDVKENCSAFYLSNMSLANCLGIWRTADLHDMGQLKDTARDFVMDRFVEVSKCDEFIELCAEDLFILLRDDEINVTSEEEVFIALMGWVKHAPETRKQLLGTLLECIRFNHIKDSVRKKTIILICIFYLIFRVMILLTCSLILVFEGDQPAVY